MAALPPSAHERRARPGTLARPVNSRMYRGTWLLVGIPLLAAAFSVYRPVTLGPPVLEPEFDGAAATFTARRFADQFPIRVPGTQGAHDAASWTESQLRSFGWKTCRLSVRAARTRSSSCSRTGTTPARAPAPTTTGRARRR